MAMKLDEHWVNPTSEQIESALKRSVAEVHEPEAPGNLEWPLENYREAIGQLRVTPEGSHHWNGCNISRNDEGWAEIALFWWTDFVGNQHARLTGDWNFLEDWFDIVRWQKGRQVSPLINIYPERTFLQLDNGKPQLRAICDCGAIGAPEELGWMGECCGPCNDRNQGADETISITGKVNRALQSGHARYRDIAWSSSGQFLAANGIKEICVFDLNGPDQPRKLSVANCGEMAFVPDQPVLIIKDMMEVHEWNLDAQRQRELFPSGRILYEIVCSPNGKYIAGIRDCVAEVWERSSGQHYLELSAPEHRGSSALAFLPNGELIQAHPNGSLTFWDLDKKSKLCVISPGDQGWGSIAVAPNGSTLALATFPTTIQDDKEIGEIVIYDCAGHRVISRWPARHYTHSASTAFSPDGLFLASSDEDNEIAIHRVDTGEKLKEILLHSDFGAVISSSPDGQWLTLLFENSVRLWSWSHLLHALDLQD